MSMIITLKLAKGKFASLPSGRFIVLYSYNII